MTISQTRAATGGGDLRNRRGAKGMENTRRSLAQSDSGHDTKGDPQREETLEGRFVLTNSLHRNGIVQRRINQHALADGIDHRLYAIAKLRVDGC
jgi:hypothetical protein